MRVNYLGIVGGILGFISLLLPWWTVSVDVHTAVGSVFMGQATVYLYQATAIATVAGSTNSEPVFMNLWFGWTALALVVIGGWLGLAGSVTKRAQGRTLLALGGSLIISSIIVFAAGLQYQITDGTWASGFPTGLGIGVFSSGSHQFDLFGSSENYFSYLSFGFWLALIAGVMMFIALRRKSDGATSLLPQSSPTPARSTLKGLNQITYRICLRRNLVELVISSSFTKIDALNYTFSFQDFKMLGSIDVVHSN